LDIEHHYGQRIGNSRCVYQRIAKRKRGDHNQKNHCKHGKYLERMKSEEMGYAEVSSDSGPTEKREARATIGHSD
jgi:hypothetical protein